MTAGRFVDCSSNNPAPNLVAYAAGHKHLCRKVSEGVNYHWSQSDAIVGQAHSLGLRVGHYHWLRPDSSPIAQAIYFVRLVGALLKPGDWLMTDFERTTDAADPADVTRAAQLHEFNAYVCAHLPSYPLYVYTGNWYLDGKPHCQAEVRRWPVVMSDYSGVKHLPNPYSLHYVGWQFTDQARVPGWSAPVDYNRWLIEPVVKYPSTDPHWSDMATQADIEKLIAEALQAVLLGGDHGAWTQKSHPWLVNDADHGVLDRLRALEQK